MTQSQSSEAQIRVRMSAHAQHAQTVVSIPGRLRNCFEIKTEFLEKVSGIELDHFIYQLSLLDRDVRIKGGAVCGSSVFEKSALFQSVRHKLLGKLSQTIQCVQLQEFPDFIIFENGAPTFEIEIVRITHQAVEELRRTVDSAQSWSPFSRPENFSNTPVLRYLAPGERYNPAKIVDGMRNGGADRQFMYREQFNHQLVSRAFDELQEKISKFSKRIAVPPCAKEVVVLDVDIKVYGLNLLGNAPLLAQIKENLKLKIENCRQTSEWSARGGVIIFRIEGLHSSDAGHCSIL